MADTVTVCGVAKSWSDVDFELGLNNPKGAGYPGPFDHSDAEKAAYEHAACPNGAPTTGAGGTLLGGVIDLGALTTIITAHPVDALLVTFVLGGILMRRVL